MTDGGDIASKLIEAARERELPTASRLLQQPAVHSLLVEMAPMDAALDAPASKQLPIILTTLARRGLDPDATSWLWPHFEPSPLRRSLVGWDIVTSSLLAPATLDVFRDIARDAAPVVGGPGRCVCSPAIARELAARFADPTASAAELTTRADAGDTAALVELAARGGDLAARARAQAAAARDQAISAGHAHLSALASADLALIWQTFDDRAALLALAEVLLDAGAVDDVPPLDRFGDDAAYVEYRQALVREDAAAAMAAARKLRDVATARAAAVRVDVASRIDRRDEAAERVLREGAANGASRFMTRVDTVARVLAGEDPTPTIDAYLARFGDDRELWRELAAVADRVDGLAPAAQRIIGRELFFLPNNAAAWRAFALMVGDPFAAAVEQEVMARLIAQSTFV